MTIAGTVLSPPIPPTTIPKPESPALEFRQYAVMFHFTWTPDVRPTPRQSDDDSASPHPCDRSDWHFDSIERDVLSHGYRDETLRPFRTHTITPPPNRDVVQVQFADKYSYEAEGSVHKLERSVCRNPTCRVTAAITHFRNGLKVLHLGLHPGRSVDVISEYEAIRLIKLWEQGEGVGIGDKFCMHCRIGFTFPKEGESTRDFTHLRFTPRHRCQVSQLTDAMALHELAEAILAESVDAEKGCWRLAGGSLQLLHANLLELLAAATVQSDGAIPEVFSSRQEELLAFAGIQAGLLDFKKVDDDELVDTLRPLKPSSAVEISLANKATVLGVFKKCRLYESRRDALGANPYLWLPHTLAIYDEELFRMASTKAEQATRDDRPKAYVEAEKKMRPLLHEDVIGNVFHYDHERQLFTDCKRTRGLKDLEADARQLYKSVRSNIDDYRKSEERLFARFLEIVGVVIAVVGIFGAYSQIGELITGDGWLYTAIAAATLVCFLGLVAFSYLRYRRRIPEHAERILYPAAAFLGIALFFLLLGLWAKSLPQAASTPEQTQPAAIK